MPFDRSAVADALRGAGSIAAAARLLGCERRRLSEYVNGDEGLRALRNVPTPDRASVTVKGDEAEITGPAISGTPDEVVALIRENGLDPDEWVITSTTLNKWDGPTKGGGKQTLRQVKVTLRRKPEFVFPTPVAHVPALVKPKAPALVSVHEPDLIFVEGDHQAPYFDERLDALATRATAEVQPVEHVFLGDGADFPTISRHDDHPAAMATVQDCLDAYYGVLRRRADAAPHARRRKLKGNHDWRLESELLKRAERMYGVRPVGESLPALSLVRLLHLERLGVELVEDPRGWEHAEVEIVPGPKGLVVRHGWITGANSAERSMKRRGRSLIFGHLHQRDHAYWYDPSVDVEREAAVLGTMSLTRDRRFPHFAVCDQWTQGFGVVTRWRDGRFQIEHARYSDGVLTWRHRRWEAQ